MASSGAVEDRGEGDQGAPGCPTRPGRSGPNRGCRREARSRRRRKMPRWTRTRPRGGSGGGGGARRHRRRSGTAEPAVEFRQGAGRPAPRSTRAGPRPGPRRRARASFAGPSAQGGPQGLGIAVPRARTSRRPGPFERAPRGRVGDQRGHAVRHRLGDRPARNSRCGREGGRARRPRRAAGCPAPEKPRRGRAAGARRAYSSSISGV